MKKCAIVFAGYKVRFFVAMELSAPTDWLNVDFTSAGLLIATWYVAAGLYIIVGQY